MAKVGLENSIVHVGDHTKHERAWFVVHTDRGAVLLGLWYRRPAPKDVDSIEDIYDEVRAFSENSIPTIIMGDMNVHEQTGSDFLTAHPWKAVHCKPSRT